MGKDKHANRTKGNQKVKSKLLILHFILLHQ